MGRFKLGGISLREVMYELWVIFLDNIAEISVFVRSALHRLHTLMNRSTPSIHVFIHPSIPPSIHPSIHLSHSSDWSVVMLSSS